jgi:hypothetical protein
MLTQEKVCECAKSGLFPSYNILRPVKPKSLGMPTKLDFIGFPYFKTFDYLTGDLEAPEIAGFVSQFKF